MNLNNFSCKSRIVRELFSQSVKLFHNFLFINTYKILLIRLILLFNSKNSFPNFVKHFKWRLDNFGRLMNFRITIGKIHMSAQLIVNKLASIWQENVFLHCVAWEEYLVTGKCVHVFAEGFHYNVGQVEVSATGDSKNIFQSLQNIIVWILTNRNTL